MLKLHRLEVSGFKSFVDPVGLEFGGGVTAIVGPNGCGKSNLAEAMTWVLGEQSAKSLRGGTMEDVIFNGSERRAPLGMGEVSLTLLTDPSFPASEEGRMTIARRVFRSGESQYRLNGKLVRLKEIKDLLMDTGLGLRAYSVIEQGKIGMILSGKPQERRRLIEEAAGITRYKARKRIAEVKLEEAAANLLRLDDIISEVERALRSLKRQAAAARRYQEKEIEYRALAERVMLGRWSVLHAALGELADRLAEAVAREAGQAAALYRQEAELAAGREALEELARAVAERHQRAAELAATIEGRQEFLKGARRSRDEIGERAVSGRALAEQRRQEIERDEAALAGLEERRQGLAAERDGAAAEVSADEERIATVEGEVAAAERQLEAVRQELLGGVAEISRLKNRLQQEQLELERGGVRRQHLTTERDERAHELAQAGEAVALAADKVQGLEAALAERTAEAADVARRLDETMKREAEAGERRRAGEARIAANRQRQELLTELSAAHAERRAALEEALAAAGVAAPEFLAGRADALAGWERSLDFYLGELADAVLLPAPGDGPDRGPDRGPDPALDLARALAGGRSTARLLSPQTTSEAGEPAPASDDPAVVLSLGEALGLPPGVAAALPPAYLVERAEDAARLARRHPGVAFLAREPIWAVAGLLHVEGAEVRPGVLERERELAALDAALPRLETELAAAVAEIERRVEERSALARESNRLQGEVAQLRQEAAVAEVRRQDAEARHRRLAVELATLSTEHQEVERELARVSGRRGEVEATLGLAEERQGELERRADHLQGEVEAARAGRESLRTESAGRRGRLELLAERLASHDREMARVGQAIGDGRRQIELWLQEAERLIGRRDELGAQIERAESELASALERRAASQEEVLVAQERLDERRAGLKLAEEELQRLRREREETRSAIEELRVRQASLRQDAGHLAATFQESFGRELPGEPGPAIDDLAVLEGELARTKEALDRLGPVNLLAVEEHAEQEERHGFLTTQRADVAASVESLKQTIREINQTSSERFQETFVEVNRAFGAVFAELFRGGEAEMRLLDEEDLLESGIEIVARPPGKRLQNLMLLSGGEKALTAIALLFALFRTKPSPLCILDEVDAPLDDVNTLRFVDLLRQMTSDTQFLVITHNKLTMEVASTIYGVTMEERGVSKLVSVAMSQVQPERQAVSA